MIYAQQINWRKTQKPLIVKSQAISLQIYLNRSGLVHHDRHIIKNYVAVYIVCFLACNLWFWIQTYAIENGKIELEINGTVRYNEQSIFSYPFFILFICPEVCLGVWSASIILFRFYVQAVWLNCKMKSRVEWSGEFMVNGIQTDAQKLPFLSTLTHGPSMRWGLERFLPFARLYESAFIVFFCFFQSDSSVLLSCAVANSKWWWYWCDFMDLTHTNKPHKLQSLTVSQYTLSVLT